MSEADDTINTPQATNPWGVMIAGEEDFTQWTWDPPTINTDAISAAAAKVVLDEVIESASHHETIIDGRFHLSLAIFDASVVFNFSLLSVVDGWLESIQRRDGTYDCTGEHRARTEIMLADMEEACAKLRQVLGP